MTLEQVFIAIGDQEIADEIKKNDAEGSAAKNEANLIDQMPAKTPTNSCDKFKALLMSNFHSLWQAGMPGIILILGIFLIIIFAAIYIPLSLREYKVVDYSNLSTIYGLET
mmetsp:Transcript_14897/g.18703  ORF Transcript_14897/g.18703 Transcript_14897/m.18703 type:complete len:111 (+) Transcript_14897:2753-3085(+)